MKNVVSKFKIGASDYYGKPFYFVHAAGGIAEHTEKYIKGMETGPEKTEASIIRFGGSCKAEVRKHDNGTADYSETILTDNEAYSSQLKHYLESALGRSTLIKKVLEANENANWNVDSQRHQHMAGGGEHVTGSDSRDDYISYDVTFEVTAKTLEEAVKELRRRPMDELLAEGLRKMAKEEAENKGHAFKFKTIFLVKTEIAGVPRTFEEPVVREIRSLVESAQTEMLM